MLRLNRDRPSARDASFEGLESSTLAGDALAVGAATTALRETVGLKGSFFFLGGDAESAMVGNGEIDSREKSKME